MEGYDVVTTGDEKVGKVVGKQGDNLIVEHGTIRKSKHALPLTFARVDDGERVVRTTLGKEIFLDSPQVNGDVDEATIADYYGLAEGSEAPLTEGWGETVGDDPSVGSETVGERTGVKPTPQQRAETREQLGSEEHGGVPEKSPAMLGDRYEHTRDED
jgi:hypothetical protein